MFTWIDFHGKLFDLKTRNKNEPTVFGASCLFSESDFVDSRRPSCVFFSLFIHVCLIRNKKTFLFFCGNENFQRVRMQVRDHKNMYINKEERKKSFKCDPIRNWP